MIADAVYVLGMAVTLLCTVLLLRGFARTRQRLLLWAGVCFAGLTLGTLLVFLDLSVYGEDVDLYRLRLTVGAVSMLILLYGLIFESD